MSGFAPPFSPAHTLPRFLQLHCATLLCDAVRADESDAMQADESGEITQLMCTLGISQMAVTHSTNTCSVWFIRRHVAWAVGL